MVKSNAIFLSVFFIISLLLPVSAATSDAPTGRSETDFGLVSEPTKEPVNAGQLVGTTPETDFIFSDGTIVQYIGTDTIVDIPNEIGGEKVLHIGDSAFKYTNVLSVTIPEGVTDIGASAFSYCTSLIYVSIPGTMTVLYDYAFSPCTNLTSINLPENLKVIGVAAFAYCSSLPIVVIPKSVVYMGRSAFYNCTALKNAILSDQLAQIEPSSFENCSSLKSIILPDSVTYIGNGAFEGCTALENVILSDHLTRIDSVSFKICWSLKSIVLPDSVTYVGTGAFSGCYALENVVLSNQLTRIEPTSFFDCTSLKSIVLPDSVTYVGNSAFEGCGNVNNLSLSKNLTFIDDMAFAYIKYLQNIKLPSALTYIGQSAFTGCSSLKSVVISSRVNFLRDYAFYNSYYLESAYFLGNTPAYWGKDVFGDGNPGFTIYYLSESSGFTTPTYRGYQSVCQYKVGIIDTKGGTITPEEDWAVSGQTVTLTVTPCAGCITSSVYYTDIYGTHAVTGNSFIMPDSDVDVGAVFVLSVGSWIYIVFTVVILIGLVLYLFRLRS